MNQSHEKDNELDMALLNQLLSNKQYAACMTQAKAVLTRHPDSLGALTILAEAAIPLGQLSLALGILLRLLAHNPQIAVFHYLLALVYKDQRNLDEAITHAKLAYQLSPQKILFCETVAKLLFDRGDFDEALQYYQIITQQQSSPVTHFDSSLCLLALGQYQTGWQGYESRLPLNLLRPGYLHSPMPSWDGKMDIRGKKLLVLWEQGFGDVIQFMRFIPLLKQRTHAHIGFVCEHALEKIAKNINGIEEIYTTSALPEHDYKIYLLSLPFLLGINHEKDFIRTLNYISASDPLIAKWHNIIQKNDVYKIGICWEGSSKYRQNNQRNCPLGKFIELLNIPRCQFISLQKYMKPEDKEILSYASVMTPGEALSDFSDIAAVIANVDLVISVDTAVAHLAGAMGKPVWALIRYETEWRHPRDRDISPWYPTMRLFRQAKPGDWDSVFQAVRQALAQSGCHKKTN